MTNYTVNRVGQQNSAGATDALFLKVFGGEVLTAFEETCKMKDRVNIRTITSGKSASFPRTGRLTAAYHTPGTELTGSQQNLSEVVITIDDLLIAHQWIANIDEAKLHYDVRSIYSSEIGKALANQWDKHVMQMGIIGARSANPLTGLPGGSQILTNTAGAPGSADYMNNGGHLAQALFLAAQQMDQNAVPEEDRYCFVRPAQYYALASTFNNINKWWGGMGSYADGTIMKIAGFEIIKAIHFPGTNIATGTVDAGTSDKYKADFTLSSALCMHKSAIGTVKLMDLALETDYRPTHQATLVLGKYAVGHGILRNEALVEIKNSSVAG